LYRFLFIKPAKSRNMNPQIGRLAKIAAQPERLIIGLMSGTSVDGLDVALCRIAGAGASTQLALLQFATVPYTEDFKNEIQSVFAKKLVSLEKLCLLNGWVARQHATMIRQCLQRWQVDPSTVDAIASHGQTVYHAPKALHGLKNFGDATMQIGDGDHLAVATGIITLSDFRQKHIAAGGEGAPLAVYGDYLLFRQPGQHRLLLNMGGIANFTWLPAADNQPVFSTDTGPGNTMMDAYIQQHFPGKYFDEDAALARAGTINTALLSALKNHPFFEQPFPKTTGPELFNLAYLEKAAARASVYQESHANMMATLNRFSADTIVQAVQQTMQGIGGGVALFASGGGMHNPLLMQNIASQLPNYTIATTSQLQIAPDAKEAVLFALLANETLAGGNYAVPGNPHVCMGKISLPN
jgi:anhydro-N-acetylmuramic acid kinase